MKKSIILIIALICFYSCTKQEITTIKLKGVITNDATGLPVKNVAIWIVLLDYQGEHTYSDSSATNSLGEYSLDVTGYDIDYMSVKVNKPGFVFYTFEPEKNSDIIKNIELYPYDSHIKFKIINKLGIRNSVYGIFWPSIYGEYWQSAKYQNFLSTIYPDIFVNFGEIYTETRLCTGDNYIYVTWDYDFYNSELKFPNLDSLYVPRGDTANYTIQF